jgi:hypothetical protein
MEEAGAMELRRVAREMKFVWKSGKQQVRLSGIVDYSLWYGKRNDSRFTLASTVRIITSMRDRISALFGGEWLVAMP